MNEWMNEWIWLIRHEEDKLFGPRRHWTAFLGMNRSRFSLVTSIVKEDAVSWARKACQGELDFFLLTLSLAVKVLLSLHKAIWEHLHNGRTFERPEDIRQTYPAALNFHLDCLFCSRFVSPSVSVPPAATCVVTEPLSFLKEKSCPLNFSCRTNGWHETIGSPCSTRIRCWEALELLSASVPRGLVVPRLGTERYASAGESNLDCLAPGVPQSCKRRCGEHTFLSVSWSTWSDKPLPSTRSHREIKHRARQSVPPSEQIPVHQ